VVVQNDDSKSLESAPETVGKSAAPSEPASSVVVQNEDSKPPESASGTVNESVKPSERTPPPSRSEPVFIVPKRIKTQKNWKRHDGDLYGPALRALGLRASVGSVTPDSHGRGSDHPVGGSVVERGMGLLDYGAFDARYFDYLEFGKGSKGWTYRADGQLSLGPRWLWTHSTGGVLRLGARAHIADSGKLYSSDVRIPTLAVGVRHESSAFHLDLAVEYAPVLAGYLEPPKASYDLRKSHSGAALLSLTLGRFRFDGEFARYWPDSGPNSVNDGRGWGCAYLGWGMVCVDGRWVRVPGEDGHKRVNAISTGLSVLVSQYDWLISN
jgi:hypothetical protein